MDHDLLINLLTALLTTGLLASFWIGVNARCRSLIAKWAEHGAWEVVDCRRCLLRAGPFSPMPGMPVYRVELENRSGKRREAYIRCGDPILSVLADRVAVEWSDR